MTYEIYDASTQDGAPVHLFLFVNEGTTYRYTNMPDGYTALGYDWTHAPIGIESEIETTEEIHKENVDLKLPIDDAFAGNFFGSSHDYLTSVTIYRGHRGEPTEEFIVFWKGRVSNHRVRQSAMLLTCESVFTSLRRPGLRRRYQVPCQHMLYRRGCTLDMEDFDIAGTVATVSGTTVQVSAASGYTDGYFTGGMLEAIDGKLRFIVNHVGDTLTLQRELTPLAVSDAIRIFPGCDRTKETCNTTFSNLVNFGGFPAMPDRNPFNGESLY